jgi:enamine deaminase RidA (YjgF/YER057c/UK114 family)
MKKQTVSESVIRNPIPSHAIATLTGPFMFMSGQLGLSPNTGRPYSGYREHGGKPPFPALGLLAPDSWEEAFVTQTRTIFERIGALLKSQGGTAEDIIFHSVYVRSMRNFPTLARTRSRLFGQGLAPPVTSSQVGGLPMSDGVVYFDPVGFVPTDGYRLETLQSRHLEQSALSNYQFGTKVGPLMFLAGVVGAIPERGEIIHGTAELPANIPAIAATGSPATRAFNDATRAQTLFIYDLIRKFLRDQGADLEQLVKLNIYLRDVRDTDLVEAIAQEFAPRAMPAIALYGVESLATRWFQIEIDGIAIDPMGPWQLEPLGSLDDATDAVRPQGRHNVAMCAGPLIFTSTITSYNVRTDAMVNDLNQLPERGRKVVENTVLSQPRLCRSPTAIETAVQTWLIYDRLLRIAAHFGSSADDFLKTTVYLRDILDLDVVDTVAQNFFPHTRPALTILQPHGLSMPEARVQVDAIILRAG